MYTSYLFLNFVIYKRKFRDLVSKMCWFVFFFFAARNEIPPEGLNLLVEAFMN